MSNDIFLNGFIDVAVVTPPPVGTLTLNPDGTFTFVPPENFSGELTFEYSFIDPASGILQTAIATITLAPVVDDPIITAPNFTGDEDTPVPLTGLNVTLEDDDGSETVDIQISGVPAGAGFDVGTDLGGGVWSFTPAQLAVANFLPNPNLHTTYNLTITATTTETATGDSSTDSLTFSIDIEAQADAPTLNTGTTLVDEENSTVFGTDISYGLVDTDGSEVVSQVEIGAVPVGAVVAYTVTPGAVVTPVGATGFIITGDPSAIAATLDTFEIKPPLNSSDDFDLTVAVTTTDADGSTATTNDTHTIEVTALADAPTVTTGTTPVDEDISTVFGTDITYALVDVDGSEVVSQVEIADIPVGATMTFTPSGAAIVTPVIVGGNTVGYTVTGTQAEIRATLDTFEILPPAHSNVDFDLTISVTTTDVGGDTATTNSTHTIDIEAEADAPTVTTGTTLVDEDVPTAFGTDITYALVDADGSEVISQVELGAIPVGGSVAMVASGAAVITPVVVGGNTVGYTVTGTEAEIRATLDTATITTPLHSDADFNLTVAVTTTDADGSTATTNDLHTIDIEAQADAPTVSTATTNIDEDTSTVFGTDVTYALVDADGSEVVQQVEIGAIPVGAVAAFTASGAAVVTPVIVGGNTTGYTITGTQAEIRATLDTFEIQSPLHSDTDFDLTIAVTTLDADGSTATTNSTHTIQVLAVADTPGAVGQNYTTDEDVAINFAGLDGSLSDIDGSETLSFQITGVDPDATFDVGTNEGGGVWSFTEAEINAGVSYTPPPQEHGTFNMVLEAIATEAAVGGQVAVKTAVGTAPIVVTVDAVLDTPTLNNGATTVNEDVTIPLGSDIDLDLVDVDGSQTMVITLTGIPAANTLNFNGALPGSVTGPVGGVYTISGTAQEAMDLLDSITVTTPAHDDTDFTVAVSVQTTETSTGDTVTVNASHDVTVSAVADAPNLSAAAVTVNEDTAIAIPVVTSLVDTDGTEQLDFVEISGIPAGATFTYNMALPGTVTNPSAGTVRFAGTEVEIQNLVASLTIQPALHLGGDITLTATAQTTEFNPTDVGDVAVLTATSTVPINIDVVPVADQPTVSVGGVAGVYNTEEDTSVALTGFGGALIDGDGSETLTYTITGAPAGATFSSGSLSGGVWTFTAAEITAGISYTPPLNLHGTFNMTLTSIATLAITPPPNYSGVLSLTLEAFSLETSNGDAATATAGFDVNVTPVGDDVLIKFFHRQGDEGTEIDLKIRTQLGDKNGNSAGENPKETVEVTFSSVPDGAVIGAPAGGTLTDQGGGVWVFEGTQAESRQLTIMSIGIEGDYDIGISAVSNDNGVLGTPIVGVKTITFNHVDDQTLTGTAGDETITGAAGDDTINGLAGIDILSGGSGADIIDGGLGNDTITGGLGADTLTGGAGADTFMIGADDTLGGAVDTITDFSLGDSDALDLSALLPGYNSGTDDIADFVNLVESGGNTTVQIDQTGTGTFNTDVAIFTGVTGLDVNVMEANTNLIV